MKATIAVYGTDGRVTRSEIDVMPTAEVHALLRAVAEEVGKLRHNDGCNSAFCSRCLTPIDRYEHWARDFDAMQHQFDPNDCNCPRGRALALLEVKP